ncbi:hypothetical protein E1287_34935 [Actinomadura sp. KC06]|uniref:hypothetical protein n=1 Tax=Actinomadura sp. KC06 TaxID=2530369 RepID=UPI00104ED9F8|nr:hypothetical protein [Actinomadura sp. KC06]TDD27207.1 hypothetical protein E1287_34935 [Actinomadura sp. KC06]
MERSDPVLLHHPANQVLLDYLKARARRPKIGDIFTLDGWELRTHPEFLERFEEIAPDDAPIIPLFGVAALAANGIAAAAALGTDWLMIRLPQLPDTIETRHPIPPLSDNGWQVASAWQSGTPSAEGKRRLTHLLDDALDHARTLNP